MKDSKTKKKNKIGKISVLKFVGSFVYIFVALIVIALLCNIINASLLAAGTQTILEMILVILCAAIAMTMLFPAEYIVVFFARLFKKKK